MTRQTTLLERAADRTTDAVETAREVTKEFVESTAKPKIHDAAAKTAPIVAAGAAMAAERAAQAKEFAEAKSAELTGRKKKRTGRKLLLFGLLGALAAAAAVLAKRFLGDSGEWTSAAPASTPQTPAETVYTDQPVEDLSTPVNEPPYSSN